MLLIGAAYLLGVNIDAMVAYIGDQNETVVYMNLDATEDQIAAADSAIRSTEHVVGVTYVIAPGSAFHLQRYAVRLHQPAVRLCQ